MSTRIVFDNGLKLIVAQDEAAVADALSRQLTLERRGGGPLHINWEHVVFIGPTRAAAASSGAARRSPTPQMGTRAAPAAR
jgi:hypothetical protein